MAFRVQIVVGSTAPIYRQIVDQVRTAVATGALVEGDALPSVRALATELVVNPNTVAKAYAELCRDGVAESQRGRGMFIAARRQLLALAERRRRLTELGELYASEATLLGFTREQALQLIDDLFARWDEGQR